MNDVTCIRRCFGEVPMELSVTPPVPLQKDTWLLEPKASDRSGLDHLLTYKLLSVY